jgi:YbbR domain-containing protein
MMSFVREKLLENWILKIIALLLAWVLWLFIQGEPENVSSVTTVTAPVEVHFPEGMEISSGLISTVQVVIRGSSQPLNCIINLQNAKEGEHRIVLTEDQIKSPKGEGVEVFQVNPPQVVLMLEKTISKTVPITVPVQGEVADGFEIYDIDSTPKEVEIVGPRNHIEPVEEASTEIIDLDGKKQSISYRAGLNFKDGTIRSTITDPVLVAIQIGPRRKMFVVKDVPVDPGDASYISIPEKVNIQVMAPESLKDALVPDRFSLTVDISNVDESAFPLKTKPRVLYQEDWLGLIKISGTKPPEVSIQRKDSTSPKR